MADCVVVPFGQANQQGLRRVRCIHCAAKYGFTPDPGYKFIAPNCPGAADQRPTEFDPRRLFKAGELAELFPDSDPKLIGDRLKWLFQVIGFPPCVSCSERAAWLNQAHLKLRKLFSGSG